MSLAEENNLDQYTEAADNKRVANVVRTGFIVILVLLLLLGSITLYQLNKFNENIETIVNIYNKKTEYAYDMRDAIRKRAISLYTMLSTDDYFSRDEELLRFYDYAGEYRKARESQQGHEVSRKSRGNKETRYSTYDRGHDRGKKSKDGRGWE
ncbi:MAG: MCP four helix bundle domain-containing protein [Deltaproteobacteria bacterium]